MNIDMHSHFMPKELADYISKHEEKLGTKIIDINGKPFVKHKEGSQYPFFDGFHDINTKLEDMKKMRLDHAVLSVNPGTFFYWVDAQSALDTSKICNDWVSEVVKNDPEHFSGMATLPMQDIDLSLKELDRSHNELGLNSVEIGPVINDEYLDEKKYLSFFEYCETNNILVMLHPYYISTKPGYPRYFNTNLICNVHETNLAINAMIFGGIFEKFPKLKVLCSHGGGNFPYQLGRLMHGFEVRPEPKVNISKSPENYLGGLYFDTIVFWTPALQFLVDNFGTDKVVVGTDYPYDMGDMNPIDSIEALRLTTQERKMISEINATNLLNDRF
ncbi:MAG: amidohydrolase family protein [Eubacteriales bacterium]|nr:amidohydrolase family protein [Eubacteriales bacterium]